jgi:hypothetical protein
MGGGGSYNIREVIKEVPREVLKIEQKATKGTKNSQGVPLFACS